MSQNCPRCGSFDIVKKGFRYNRNVKKQKYCCNKCNAWFVEDDGFKRMRHKPKIVVRAIHMHEDGMSLSKVKNHLWQHDNVRVTRGAIAYWIKKYSVFLKSPDARGQADHKRKNTHG